VAERDRIARDLHDTLLQSVEGLIMKVYVAVRQLPPDHPTRAFLSRCLDQAEALSVEGRRKLLELSCHSSTRLELTQALAALGVELSTGTKTTFCALQRGLARELATEWDEVFGIAREAIVNAFKHSQAHHIEATVIYRPSCLIVQVQDDGCGIGDAESAGPRGLHCFGLRAMHQRAELLRATLQIATAVNKGTKIRLIVPFEGVHLERVGAAFLSTLPPLNDGCARASLR
jgi:signal transduction histidine kinase